MSDDTPGFEPTCRQWTGYWCMIVQQTQNAFNNQMSQFILIALGGAVSSSVESAAGLMMALPFVLFAPIAGWLSDRFSKRDVILGTAVLQCAMLAGICGALQMKNLTLALCGFFAIAVQSAFFSPAKLGINKELLGSKHLGFATGIQQMTAMLAMMIGQIGGGFLFDRRFHEMGATPGKAWEAALWPLLVLTAFSLPMVVLAWVIPRVPAQGGGRFSAKLTVSHFGNLLDLWRDAPLRRASFGVAFFWGFVAYLNLWSVKLAKVMTHGGDGFGTLSSMFMVAASLGMVAGFGTASFLLRKRIELGWVPVAGIAMTVFSLALSFMRPGHAGDFLGLLELGPLVFALNSPGSALFLLTVGLLAFSSALYLAPLNAWMQDRYPAAKRGELQSAVNLQDCLAGATAVIVITGFEYGTAALGIDAKHSPQDQMRFISLAGFLATVLIIRLLPADFIRVIGTTLVRMVYRIRSVNSERIPAKGGVLLLPNHVTFADSFYLSTACHRPIRFVMDEVFMAKRYIRVFTGIFDTMTIRRDHPLEAIREIIRALQNGDVVCLFPEGQLTRTGTLCELQRGFELIAKKAGHPLIPVWVDGSWGSVFSFERNGLFGKSPVRPSLGITVAFGQSIPPGDATLENVRNGLLTTSADAIGQRFRSRDWLLRMPKARNAAVLGFRALENTVRRRMWTNGHQIGMINALPRRHMIHALKGDPVLTDLPGLFAAFPELFHAGLFICDTFDGDHSGNWVGGDLLRDVLQSTQITGKRIVFYDFGTHALQPVERAGLCHCPCLAVAGTVVSMSMPHPPPPTDNFEPQKGRKIHSWGKLLPGWYLVAAANPHLRAHGPAGPADGLPLPAGCQLDSEGFLIDSVRISKSKP